MGSGRWRLNKSRKSRKRSLEFKKSLQHMKDSMELEKHGSKVHRTRKRRGSQQRSLKFKKSMQNRKENMRLRRAWDPKGAT